MARRVAISLSPRIPVAATAAFVSGMCLSGLAHEAVAQEMELDEVVVTGSAFQNRAEISARLEAIAIVDTLSRDEIGALPDITIAESMRRITGVTTIYNDDIGQFASIRGVHPDYVPVTLNGLAIATTGDLGEGTRKVNLQVIPGEAVRQLQAYKTPSPDLDAGALGGLLNIATVSAFDSPRSRNGLTLGTSYTTYMDVPDDNSAGSRKNSPLGMTASGVWAPRFGASGQFGVVLTGMYESRPRTQSNNAITNRVYFNDAGQPTTPESPDWNGFAAPDSFVSHNYTNRFGKFGGTARLEYKPGEHLHSSLFAFAYYSDEEETRNTNRVFGLDQAQDQTASTGTMRVRNADSQWRFNTFERDQRGLQWLTSFAPGEDLKISAAAGYTRAWFRSERPYATFVYRPNTRLRYDLDSDEALFVLDNAAAYTDPANYRTNTLYRDWRVAKEHLLDARVDLGFNNEADDRGWGLAAGASFRDLDLSRDNTSVNYVAGTASMEGISFVPDFALPGYATPGLWLDQQTFWNQTIATVPVNAAASANNSRLNDYTFDEQVRALYVNGNFTSDKARLDLGLRLDDAEFVAEMAQVIDGTLQDATVRRRGSDMQLLPYITARYSLTPALRLKAGISRTMGRPNPETIATAERVDETELTISRGNPQIKPLRSTNFDLGVEHFFNGGQGMATITGFYKVIKDDILNLSRIQSIGGQDYTVTEPVNGERTRYKGLELGLINNSFGGLSPWLQKVGASLNGVWVKGSSGFLHNGERRKRDMLLFQAESGVNAAVFYGLGGGSELRLAINHQGRYLEEYAANPWQQIYIEPFTTVDLTARWVVSPRWQVRVEGRNILGANRARSTGPDHEYFRAGLEVGSSWFLRLNFSP